MSFSTVPSLAGSGPGSGVGEGGIEDDGAGEGGLEDNGAGEIEAEESGDTGGVPAWQDMRKRSAASNKTGQQDFIIFAICLHFNTIYKIM